MKERIVEEELEARGKQIKNTMLMLMRSICCHVDGSNKRVEASMSQSRKWRFVIARGGVCTCKTGQLLGVCRVRWNAWDV